MRRSWFTRAELPTWIFAAAVAVAGPLLLFHYGSYHWFHRDDWSFIADRDGFPDLFEPFSGSHLVAVPRLLYLVLWEAFGITTYRPYQVPVILVHLAIGVMLVLVMRRSGVRPWLASAAGLLFVLVGPGAVNSVWAFQVGFNGSVAWGLAHMLLAADHDGPPGRRDLLGLACGLLALASSAVGISLVVGVGVAVLLRRGWKMALLHTAPLAVLYGAWSTLAEASTSGPEGRPSLEVLLTWVRNSVIGTFLGVGRFQVLALALVVVLLAGLILAWGPWRDHEPGPPLARHAMPIGLALAGLFFALTTGIGRAWLEASAARSERYVYVEAALFLPLIAVAAESLAHRWRVLAPALTILFLLPIPFNLTGFDTGVFTEEYMARREFLLTTAVRMPFVRDVPRDVRPVPDMGGFEPLSPQLGFLLTATRNGDLTPSTVPLTPRVVNEFKVRLGLLQRFGAGPSTGCRTFTEPVNLELALGDVIVLGSPAAVSTQEDGVATSSGVRYDPGYGPRLTAELPDLALQVGPAKRETSFVLCDDG